MQHIYNGGLTREQFLFYEMRIVASLVNQGLSRDEITKKIFDENLFQFPTERAIDLITRCCFRRLDALNSNILIENLATASVDVAKQINLYAMMKQNTNIMNVLFKTLITLVILFLISKLIINQFAYLISILILSFIVNSFINNYISKNKIFEKVY